MEDGTEQEYEFEIIIVESDEDKFVADIINLSTGEIHRIYSEELTASSFTIGAILGKIFSLAIGIVKTLISSVQLRNAVSNITFTTAQLQKKFKHAPQFGVSGANNATNRAAFQRAVTQHVNTSTEVFRSTLNNQQQVLVHLRGNRAVFTDTRGNFISGWNLSQAQLNVHRSGTRILRR